MYNVLKGNKYSTIMCLMIMHDTNINVAHDLPEVLLSSPWSSKVLPNLCLSLFVRSVLTSLAWVPCSGPTSGELDSEPWGDPPVLSSLVRMPDSTKP